MAYSHLVYPRCLFGCSGHEAKCGTNLCLTQGHIKQCLETCCVNPCLGGTGREWRELVQTTQRRRVCGERGSFIQNCAVECRRLLGGVLLIAHQQRIHGRFDPNVALAEIFQREQHCTVGHGAWWGWRWRRLRVLVMVRVPTKRGVSFFFKGA